MKRATETDKRTASVSRQTKETTIRAQLTLMGSGRYDIETGIGFLDHMLQQLTRHSLMDVTLHAQGDLAVDCHHTAEDIGIVLGDGLRQALGSCRGISRYGQALSVMDEALVMVAIDCSGRGFLTWDIAFADRMLGQLATASIREFFSAFALHAGLTLHMRLITGVNSHHIAEAAFKGCARALRQAITIDTRQNDAVPSTKGMLGQKDSS